MVRILAALSLALSACIIHPVPVATVSAPVTVAEPAAGAATAGAVSCGGQEAISIENKTINVPGDAISVSGQCAVEIANSTITAGGVALTISGQGTITVTNSTISGNGGVLVIGGQATLATSGSVFRGKVQRSGQSTVEDQGGNSWK